MSKPLLKKCCPKCKQILPTSQFYKDKLRLDGLRSWCKDCCAISVKAYHQTEQGKAVSRKAATNYRNTEQGKQKTTAWLKSERGLASNHRRSKKYGQSDHGKKRYRERAARSHKLFPMRAKARQAVVNAVRSGKFLSASTNTCNCGKQAQHWHHHNGYDEPHWFDVVSLCASCHKLLHNGKMVIVDG